MRQSFIAYKYFKDAAGASFLVILTHNSDELVTVTTEKSSNLKIAYKTKTILRSGTHEMVCEYTGSGTVKITLASGKTATIQVVDLPIENKLAADFYSLVKHFAFTIANNRDSYSFTDAIYYPEGITKEKSVIFSSSQNSHLDISDSENYFYTSSGTVAYLASTDLQNSFLSSLGYTNLGSDDSNIGMFRGIKDNDTSLDFITTDNEDSSVESSKVYGSIVVFALEERTPNTNIVSMDPGSINYYLTDCRDNSIPCNPTGAPTVEDCNGNSLETELINSNVSVDGGCAEYRTNCESFEFSIKTFKNATSATSDDSEIVAILKRASFPGTYTVTVDPKIGLQNKDVSFLEQNFEDIAFTEAEFKISGLYPGGYIVQVVTADGCIKKLNVVVESNTSAFDSLYACSDTAALNYSTPPSQEYYTEDACVSCDEVSGLLQIGAHSQSSDTSRVFLKNPAFVEFGSKTVYKAGSSPTGSSSSDGKISFGGIKFTPKFDVIKSPNLVTFNPATKFSHSQKDKPFYYNLFKANSENVINQAIQLSKSGEDGLTYLKNNSVKLINGLESTGAPYEFKDLAAGYYAIVPRYATTEEPVNAGLCYSIIGPYIVEQSGCTDPKAINFNPDAEYEDNSCRYSRALKGCTDPKAENYNRLAEEDDGSCYYKKVVEDVFGCTDPAASNYNISATKSDGSCIYNTKGSYKCVKGKCEFIPGDYTGIPTLQACLDFNCPKEQQTTTRKSIKINVR